MLTTRSHIEPSMITRAVHGHMYGDAEAGHCRAEASHEIGVKLSGLLSGSTDTPRLKLRSTLRTHFERTSVASDADRSAPGRNSRACPLPRQLHGAADTPPHLSLLTAGAIAARGEREGA